MSEPQPLQACTHELEARLLLSRMYDEDCIDDIMDIYRDVAQHIGFTDRRRDERFIVKFHDILYYEPDEAYEDKDTHSYYDELFDQFCNSQYDYIADALQEIGVDVDNLLTSYNVGHYKAFKLYIPYIAQDNVIDVTEEIWANDLGCRYASEYVYVVNWLQDLEDSYMEYWIEFLKDNEFPDTYIKQIEDAYNEDHNNNNNQPQQPQQLKEK